MFDLFGRKEKKAKAAEKKELDSFASSLNIESAQPKPVTNETVKQTQQSMFTKNEVVNRLNQVKTILFKQGYASDDDLDQFETIIQDLKLQSPSSDNLAARKIDMLIMHSLKMIEKQSNGHGYLAIGTYLNRLEELIGERNFPSAKYTNQQYLQMDIKRFELMVSYDTVLNNKDRLEKSILDIKKRYFEFKERGKTVEAKRLMENAKNYDQQIQALDAEVAYLAKKRELANRFCSAYAVNAYSAENQFSDDDCEFISSVCSENIYDEKRLNQCFDILDKYEAKKRANTPTSINVNTNDFTSAGSTSISEADEEAIFGKY